MKTARQRLLDHIQQHTLVTVADLSQAMQVTPANVRHHLAILLEQGLVEAAGDRPSGGKGRPKQLYRLAATILGDYLPRLASALLSMLAGMSEGEPDALVKEAALQMLKEAGVEPAGLPGAPGNLLRRLNGLVGLLNEWHYQARWEAHAEAPHLVLGHCPYRGIPDAHPEICKLDQSLFELSLGRSVEQFARRQPDRRGVPICLFRVM